jgi:hypothetical protein
MKIKVPFIVLFLLLTGSLCAEAQNTKAEDGEFLDTPGVGQTICDTGFAYYYSVKGKYPRSSSTLLREVHDHLTKQHAVYTGSGYITLRFVIGCEGKILPGVQAIQTDEQYQKYQFDKGLVKELFAFVKTLDQWKVASFQNGQKFSYVAFLSFKIDNGKVINIIP